MRHLEPAGISGFERPTNFAEQTAHPALKNRFQAERPCVRLGLVIGPKGGRNEVQAAH